MRQSPHRKKFLDVMSDGQRRKSADIKKLIGMKEKSSVTMFINNLASRLLTDGADIKIKSAWVKSKHGARGGKEWWIEKRPQKRYFGPVTIHDIFDDQYQF